MTERIANPAVLAPEYGTVREAARLLGVGRGALAAAIRSGDVRAYRPGRRWTYVRLAEVRTWMETRAVEPSDTEVAARVDRSLRRARIRARHERNQEINDE